MSSRSGLAGRTAYANKRREKRSQALLAAAAGSSAHEISRRFGYHIYTATKIVSEHRRQHMPKLEKHGINVGGEQYLDTVGLSHRFGLSRTHLYGAIRDGGLNGVAAFNHETSKFNLCYKVTEVEDLLIAWRKRRAKEERHLRALQGLKMPRYPDLTAEETRVLVAIAAFKQETSGGDPTYEELALMADLGPSWQTRSYRIVQSLIRKGYLKRESVLVQKIGRSFYRYIVLKAPLGLVTQRVRCPDCREILGIKLPWYQPRNGNGTAP